MAALCWARPALAPAECLVRLAAVAALCASGRAAACDQHGKYPIPEQLARALALWPRAEFSQALLAQYAACWGQAGIASGFDEGAVTLTLLVGDALDTLPQLDAASSAVDAWFLDGFAPARNPELWSPALFAQLARLSAPGPVMPRLLLLAWSSAAWPRRALAMRRVAGLAANGICCAASWPRRRAGLARAVVAWPRHADQRRALVLETALPARRRRRRWRSAAGR